MALHTFGGRRLPIPTTRTTQDRRNLASWRAIYLASVREVQMLVTWYSDKHGLGKAATKLISCILERVNWFLPLPHLLAYQEAG